MDVSPYMKIPVIRIPLIRRNSYNHISSCVYLKSHRFSESRDDLVSERDSLVESLCTKIVERVSQPLNRVFRQTCLESAVLLSLTNWHRKFSVGQDWTAAFRVCSWDFGSLGTGVTALCEQVKSAALREQSGGAVSVQKFTKALLNPLATDRSMFNCDQIVRLYFTQPRKRH